MPRPSTHRQGEARGRSVISRRAACDFFQAMREARSRRVVFADPMTTGRIIKTELRNFFPLSFRGDAKRRTRNLEIPGLVLRTIPERHSSMRGVGFDHEFRGVALGEGERL